LLNTWYSGLPGIALAAGLSNLYRAMIHEIPQHIVVCCGRFGKMYFIDQADLICIFPS
jgi:hypothetical protein